MPRGAKHRSADRTSCQTGRRFLYHSFDAQEPAVVLASLDSTDRTILLRERSSGGPYAAPGYVLSVRDGTLLHTRSMPARRADGRTDLDCRRR